MGSLLAIAQPLSMLGEYSGDRLFWVFVVAMLVLYTIGILYYWRARPVLARAREEGRAGGEELAFELAWCVVPLALIVGVYVFAMRGKVASPSPELEVHLRAASDSWVFSYPDGKESGELKIPAGRDVKVILLSSDVPHAVSIPRLHTQVDALPGEETVLRLNVEEETRAPVLCASQGHGDPRQGKPELVVLSESEFERWLEE